MMLFDPLNLPSLRTVGMIEAADENGGKFMEVRAVAASGPSICENCGSSKLHKHGTTKQGYMDTPMFGKPTKLVVERNRYRCTTCQRTCSDVISDLDDSRRATVRLIEYVRKNALRLTFVEVHRQTGLDPRTVRNMTDDYLTTLEESHDKKIPDCLGLDEAMLGGKYRAVFTNVQKNTFFEILPGRLKRDLRTYLNAFTVEERKTVKVIVVDLLRSYREVAKEIFPQAVVVPDKFHIVRIANERMKLVRLYVRREFLKGNENEHARLALKDDRYVLDYREKTLNDKQRAVLADIKAKYPLLGAAHEAKEGFYAIYDAADKKTAIEVWDEWKATVPTSLRGYFKPLIEDLDGWHEHALAMFDHPYTNAYTEALNRFVKDVNRMGRGYSFDILRARLIYNEIAKVEETVMPRKRKPLPQKSKPQPAPLGGTMGYAGIFTSSTLEDELEQPKKVWYGAHIPTLCDLLEQGHFD